MPVASLPTLPPPQDERNLWLGDRRMRVFDMTALNQMRSSTTLILPDEAASRRYLSARADARHRLFPHPHAIRHPDPVDGVPPNCQPRDFPDRLLDPRHPRQMPGRVLCHRPAPPINP